MFVQKIYKLMIFLLSGETVARSSTITSLVLPIQGKQANNCGIKTDVSRSFTFKIDFLI